MSKARLGRNPLGKRFGASRREIAPPPPLAAPTISSLKKLKEMQIQVNWPELYEATVGRKLKKISKFFSP